VPPGKRQPLHIDHHEVSAGVPARRRADPKTDEPNMRVIVVGAGVIGLLSAWLLLRQGHAVTIVEQSAIPNTDNASYDQHRLSHDFETSLGDAIQLTDVARGLWNELWLSLGISLFVPASALAVSRSAGDLADRTRETFVQKGVKHDIVSVRELQHRFPQFFFSGARFGLLRRPCGLLRADEISSALAFRLAELGATLMPHKRVIGLNFDRTSIVFDDDRDLEADAVLVTAGAWSSGLVPQLVGRVWAHRQAVVYPAVPPRWRVAWARAPIVVDLGTPSGEWIAPPLGGLDLKLAATMHGRAEKSDLAFLPETNEGGAILAHFRDHLRDWTDYAPSRVKVCHYAVSRNGALLIERLGRGNIVVGTGCSGQGFKFAPAIASALARCVGEEADPEPVLSALGFATQPSGIDVGRDLRSRGCPEPNRARHFSLPSNNNRHGRNARCRSD
jgi:sarcosine oxidase